MFDSCKSWVDKKIDILLKENAGYIRPCPFIPSTFSSLFYGADVTTGYYPFARFCTQTIWYIDSNKKVPVGVFAYKKCGFYKSSREYGRLLWGDHQIEAVRESGDKTIIYDNGTYVGDYVYSRKSLLFDLGNITLTLHDSNRSMKILMPFYFFSNQFFSTTGSSQRTIKGKIYDMNTFQENFFVIYNGSQKTNDFCCRNCDKLNIFSNMNTSLLTTHELFQLLFVFCRSIAYYRLSL